MSYGAGIDFTGIAVPPPAGLFTGANNGLSRSSVDATKVVLGQNVGQAGSPAALFSSREIPMGAFNLNVGVVGDTGALFVKAKDTSWIDKTGADVVDILPTNNSSVAGDNGQDYSSVGSNNSVNYTNAGSTGFVNDFATSSNISIAAGAVAAVSFHAQFVRNSTGGSGDMIAFYSHGVDVGTAPASGNFRGFYHNPNLITPVGTNIAYENVTGDNYFNSGATAATRGKSGFNHFSVSNKPTAYVHIGAGAATAGNAPLKLTAGTNLSVIENGTFEYDGTHLYFSTGGVRNTLI